MLDMSHSLRNGPAGGPPAGHLVGRDAEIDGLRAFRAGARTHGGALLVTGERGIGKTEPPHAAADAASEVGTRILRGAGIQVETAMSFSGLNQVLLPALDASPQLPAVHRDVLKVALGFGEGAPPSRLVVSNAAPVRARRRSGRGIGEHRSVGRRRGEPMGRKRGA
jgi:hypothetical protein